MERRHLGGSGGSRSRATAYGISLISVLVVLKNRCDITDKMRLSFQTAPFTNCMVLIGSPCFYKCRRVGNKLHIRLH